MLGQHGTSGLTLNRNIGIVLFVEIGLQSKHLHQYHYLITISLIYITFIVAMMTGYSLLQLVEQRDIVLWEKVE